MHGADLIAKSTAKSTKFIAAIDRARAIRLHDGSDPVQLHSASPGATIGCLCGVIASPTTVDKQIPPPAILIASISLDKHLLVFGSRVQSPATTVTCGISYPCILLPQSARVCACANSWRPCWCIHSIISPPTSQARSEKVCARSKDCLRKYV